MFIYQELLYRPILNLLVWLYNIIPGQDLGLAIIVLTIIIRLVLYPLFHKSLKSQKELQDLKPKMDAVREKHKDNQQAQVQATLALYKEHKVNPLSSCLHLIVQLLVMIGLFNVLNHQLRQAGIDGLYTFVSNPGTLEPNFLNLVNLTAPSVWLGVLAAVLQFIQAKMIQTRADWLKTRADATTKMLQVYMPLYYLPALTLIFSIKLPACLPLYWVVTTLFAIMQQFIIMRKQKRESAVIAS